MGPNDRVFGVCQTVAYNNHKQNPREYTVAVTSNYAYAGCPLPDNPLSADSLPDISRLNQGLYMLL